MAPPGVPRGRCQGEGAGLCVFPALLENRTKPRGRRMRSLTMAVPTEKAAIRQAMPRGRRRRRQRGQGGGGDGRRARGCARSWLGRCARRELGLGLQLGSCPAPPRPRPRPAHAPRLAGEGSGAGPPGARALVLLLLAVAGGAPWHPRSWSRPPPRPCPATEPPGPETRSRWVSGPGLRQTAGSPSRTTTSKPVRGGRARGRGSSFFFVGPGRNVRTKEGMAVPTPSTTTAPYLGRHPLH